MSDFEPYGNIFLSYLIYVYRLHDKGVTNVVSQHSRCLCAFPPSHLQLINYTHPLPIILSLCSMKDLPLPSVDGCFNTCGPVSSESCSSCPFSLHIVQSVLHPVLVSPLYLRNTSSSAIGQASFLLCSVQ